MHYGSFDILHLILCQKLTEPQPINYAKVQFSFALIEVKLSQI